MLRTHLQAGTNLNYDLLRKYVDWLAARQLVRVETGEDGKERVSVTPQGVEAYRRLADWIREFVQGPHRR
jgi:predicted transcriptional regulator